MTEQIKEQTWEYRCVVEGWKDYPEHTFREPSMWTTRAVAERTYRWQHSRIGDFVEYDFQPHITAVHMFRRVKAGEPERIDIDHSEGSVE